MDGVYRYQRHIYDLTRKYYLLGRDRMIAGLDVPPAARVLELGCGTGRNLVLAARRYPGRPLLRPRHFRRDAGDGAAATWRAKRIAGRVKLARGDATDFDAPALFGRAALRPRLHLLCAVDDPRLGEDRRRSAAMRWRPGGSLHIVDFGRQERLPGWFGSALRAWLAKFHVAPRDAMLRGAEVGMPASRRQSLRFRRRSIAAMPCTPWSARDAAEARAPTSMQPSPAPPPAPAACSRA